MNQTQPTCNDFYPTVAVKNLHKTVEFYNRQLGFEIQFTWGDPPVHAGVTFGNATLHFNQQESAVTSSNFWLYFQVEDVDDLYELYRSRDIELVDEPQNREWGMREFNIRDLNGLAVRFGEPDYKSGEPVPVDRVDISARIEKRLACLLVELAEHKNMTIGEMLEETLLHSFEPLPDADGEGVASPHSSGTLRLIEKLKKQHGIDYKSHDAYRFDEINK